jgi:hypothetical protein
VYYIAVRKKQKEKIMPVAVVSSIGQLAANVATVSASITTILLYLVMSLVVIEVIFWVINKRGPLRWCYAAITSRFKPKQSGKKKKNRR